MLPLDDDYLLPLAADQSLPTGQDYAALRAEGLRRLQLLSGRVWTDYNDHDPGVTLLEALCFALTDVSYRAALPVPDLLAPAPPARPDNRLLLPPHQAFANHPVTLADYKKLVLDRFHRRVENAWVSQLPGPLAPPGHYQVALELYPEAPGGTSALGAPERTGLLSRVQRTLNHRRNLGEVFGPVVLLRPHPVVVGGRFDLGPGQDPIAVLALLLHALSEVPDPRLAVLAAEEALQGGLAVEELFAGPYAQHHLYVESTFQPQTKRVTLGALLRQAGLAAGPAGRFQVIDLRLYDGLAGEAAPPVEQLVFADDEVGSLDVLASLPRLTLTRRGVPVAIDQELVLRAYRKLVADANQSRQRESTVAQRQLTMAPGRHAALGRYNSVQRLLPPLFGIGEEGPPPDTAALGRAHIMQLKGYLLLFDQLLADFCAQLAHVGDFFSITPQPATYYSGSLYEVPHVAPLLPGTGISPDENWQGSYTPAAAWQRAGSQLGPRESRPPGATVGQVWEWYKRRRRNPYRRGLAALAAGNGPNQARRREFLTHMLARFGYTVRLRHEQHGTALAEDAATIAGYERLLAQLDVATYHRAAARVPLPTRPGLPAQAESGLELFLFLLAGVESLARKWARGEHLEAIERQVQLGTEPDPRVPPQLVVRGPATHFMRVLDALAGQRRHPALVPLGPDTVRLTVAAGPPTETWEATLAAPHPAAEAGAPGHDSVASRLLAYATTLDRQVERICLLDHVVLEPLAAREVNVALPPDDFYHCQATLLLPGYAYRYRPVKGPGGGRRAGNRLTLERLVRQYAPAHILLNLVWLDYPQMREWERLYAALADTSDLLRPDGRPERVTLAAAQQRARQFLEAHLPASVPPAN